MKQEPFEIWGDGEQSRNFTYVDDIVSGLILAGETIEDGSAVNAGRTEFISLNETAEAIFNILDWHPKEGITHLLDKPVGVKHRAADTTRAREVTGWEPQVTLEDGLRKTIDWYTNAHDIDTVRANLESLLNER